MKYIFHSKTKIYTILKQENQHSLGPKKTRIERKAFQSTDIIYDKNEKTEFIYL